MTEPFGEFKRKHGTGSDREHVPLTAINSYAGGGYPTCCVATGVRRTGLPTGDGLLWTVDQRSPGCAEPWLDGGEALVFALTAFGASLLG